MLEAGLFHLMSTTFASTASALFVTRGRNVCYRAEKGYAERVFHSRYWMAQSGNRRLGSRGVGIW